jgi:hypothetical protein
MLFSASMEQAGEVAMRIAILLLALVSLYFGIQKPLRGIVASEALRHSIAALLLTALLLGTITFLQRGLPSTALAVEATVAEGHHWTPLPPRQGKDLLLFFSPTTPLERLPATFQLQGAQLSVRPLGEQQRQLLIKRGPEVWSVDEKIVDLWLLRLPLP